jgi:protein subunit release factor A
MRERILSVTLADCEVQTFRAGGKGGQNQNKRDTGVRVIHHPSGARGEARDERSQLQNKKQAFLRMAQTREFKNWVRRMSGQDALLRAQVERETWPDRLLVEVKDGTGNWVKEGS